MFVIVFYVETLKIINIHVVFQIVSSCELQSNSLSLNLKPVRKSQYHEYTDEFLYAAIINLQALFFMT